MVLHPHMHYVALAAYLFGEPVYFCKGSKVVKLSEAHLLAEKKVLEEGKLAKPSVTQQ